MTTRTALGAPVAVADASGARPAGAGKHVCMLAYTRYQGDGRVRREAETLVSQGFRVRCLTVRIGSKGTRSRINGVEVWEMPVRKYQGKNRAAYVASYVRFLVATAAVCLVLLARGELDIVHAHNLPDFVVLAGLVPRLFGCKVVLDIHDSLPETFATKYSAGGAVWKLCCLEERLSSAVAHRIICVNHPQRDTLVARGIPLSKTAIAMNAPDPKIFEGATTLVGEPAGQTGHEFNLVYHGTMSHRLGVDLVIRAVAQLRPRIDELRLNLWGGGDDLASFQRLAKELHVDDIVFFRPDGYPIEELPKHLRSMHVGVVGNRSTRAGDLMLPVKLLEYVALGIPTVAPRLRTIQYYFSQDMVRFFDPEDVASMADAIYDLYAHPEKRLRQAKQSRAFLQKYGWQSQGAEFALMYKELVESPRI